jgi:PilZ domain
MQLSHLVFDDGPEKRSVRRCAPPRLTTASLLDGDGPRFGTLLNICHFGACVATEYPFASGTQVRVVIGFDSLPHTFEARGQVVWSGSLPGTGRGAYRFQGVRFTGLRDGERETLRRILGSREFQSGPHSDANRYFENLLREIGPEIEALGRKLFPDAND